MDKKELNGMLEGIVSEVAKNNGLTESQARCFVGVALQQNRDAFISVVNIPRLSIAKETTEAA